MHPGHGYESGRDPYGSEPRPPSRQGVTVKREMMLRVLLLSGLLGESAAAQTPLFHLDHLGCGVEPAILDELAGSRFLADTFAHAAPGGARDGDVAWSGFYVYGRLTYMEIFLAEGFPVPTETGDCMMALNAEAPGSVVWLLDTMKVALPASRPQRFERRINLRGREFDWFSAALFDWEDKGGLGVWALEYNPEFKRNASPDLYQEPGDITRERGAPPVAHHPHKLLEDVVGLTLALDPGRIETLSAQLRVMGYRIEDDGREAAAIAPDLTIRMRPRTGERYTIAAIHMRLTRAVPQQSIHRFGDEDDGAAALVVGPGDGAILYLGGGAATDTVRSGRR